MQYALLSLPELGSLVTCIFEDFARHSQAQQCQARQKYGKMIFLVGPRLAGFLTVILQGDLSVSDPVGSPGDKNKSSQPRALSTKVFQQEGISAVGINLRE
jgi:hypothetical protein